MQTIIEDIPKKLYTKVVGTTFENRQKLLDAAKSQNIVYLELEAETTNPYDQFAVAIYAQLYANGGFHRSKLGFLSNQERVCFNCGLVVGNGLFQESNKVSCPNCCNTFDFSPGDVIHEEDSMRVVQCKSCNFLFDVNAAKVISCPNCQGEDFGRAGLATVISRALQSNAKYTVIVTEFTGGDTDSKGNPKSLGCNIQLYLIEKGD